MEALHHTTLKSFVTESTYGRLVEADTFRTSAIQQRMPKDARDALVRVAESCSVLNELISTGLWFVTFFWNGQERLVKEVYTHGPHSFTAMFEDEHGKEQQGIVFSLRHLCIFMARP